MQSPIRAVFFDVGATLIRPTPSMGDIYRRVLMPLGVTATPEKYMEFFAAVWTELSDEVGAGNDRYSVFGSERAFWRTYVLRVLQRLGAEDQVEEATDLLHRTFADPASWAVYPDVEETLVRLRAAGRRCGVISNWDSRLPGLLEGLGLAGHFDTVVWSSAVGEEKPSARIFREALGAAGAEPGESLHVGDDLAADFHGAEAVGITGVLLNRRGAALPAAVRSIASLTELPSLVAASAAGPRPGES